MSDGVELTCPHCTYVGRAKAAPPAGAKIRCPRCRGEWTQPAAVAGDAATFEVEASPVKAKVEDGLEARVRKLERRNRVLAVVLVGLGALQILGLTAGRRPATSTAAGMEMKGELGVAKLTALDVVARRVTVVDPNGRPMGVLDGGAPTGEMYGTLELANSESECKSYLSSDDLRFKAPNRRDQVVLSGGSGTASSGLSFRNPQGESLLDVHADPDDTFIVFSDRTGRGRIQMGVSGSRTHLEYRPPNGREFEKIIP